MSKALAAKMIAITIDRDLKTVYGFLSKPENFPLWAKGLGSVLNHQDGDIWLFQTVTGPAKVRFTPANDFGIADHTVLLGQGQDVYVPMRVIDNHGASDVQITLFRQSEMSDADFTKDEGMVLKDLQALKSLLEKSF